MDIHLDSIILKGDFTKKDPTKLVIFAHGSGSSRHSPRNKFIADCLNKANISTFLFDLLTEEEEIKDNLTAKWRFDIPLLTQRLIDVTKYFQKNDPKAKIGYFGASTGAAATLGAAAALPFISAIVSRGGRPDLAGASLKQVKTPTLLLVGSLDTIVIELNKEALDTLTCKKNLTIIKGASHLFEEQGKLEEVAREATNWFLKYF